MITRCLGCGAQVAEDAQECPSCRWDFRSPPAPAAPKARPEPAVREGMEGRAPPAEGEARLPGAWRGRDWASRAVGLTAALGLGAVVAFYLVTRPEVPAGDRSRGGSPFPKRLEEAARILEPVRGAVTGEEDARQPSRIRRAAIDPFNPQLGPVEIPAGTDVRKGAGLAWVIEGACYDAVTRRPISGARILVLDAGGKVRAKTLSGPEGRYRARVEVFSEEAFAVYARHPDYAETLLQVQLPFPRSAAKAARVPGASGRSSIHPASLSAEDLFLRPRGPGGP